VENQRELAALLPPGFERARARALNLKIRAIAAAEREGRCTAA